MPKDFRKKTFQKILRGYSPDEVDAYLAYVNDEYRKLEKKSLENERKLTLAAQKIQAYEFELNKNNNDFASEEQLAESAVMAEKEALSKVDTILENARAEAAKTVKAAAEQAANEADNIVSEARKYSDEVRSKADALSKTADAMYNEIISFRDVMFELYNSHIEQIEEFVNKADSFSERTEALYTPEHTEDDSTDVYEDDSDNTEHTEDSGNDTVNNGNDIYIDLENELGGDGEQTYIDEALGLDDDEEENIDDESYDADEQSDCLESEEYEEDDNSDESEISEEDIERQRQLDRFFGIVDDDDLLSAEEDDDTENESDDFEDEEAPTRVLNIGEALRNARQHSDNGDFKADSRDSDGYVDIDSIFSGKEKRDMSLTDEFDIVYSDSSAKKSVDEIRKQPTVTASEVPKKNIKYFKK